MQQQSMMVKCNPFFDVLHISISVVITSLPSKYMHFFKAPENSSNGREMIPFPSVSYLIPFMVRTQTHQPVIPVMITFIGH